MLRNLAVLHAPQVVVRRGLAVEGALAHAQDEAALREDLVGLIVDHLDAVRRERLERGPQAGEPVGDPGVVLDVGAVREVLRGLLGVLPLHDVHEERLDEGPVLLGLVEVGGFGGAVGLRAAGGVRSGDGGEVVPVLGDEPLVVEAEDVEGHLLAGPREVVDALQEHLVAVLERADVPHRRLGGGGGQVLHGPDERVATRAVGEVVLDVALVEEARRQLGVSGGERADEVECFLDVAHFTFLSLWVCGTSRRLLGLMVKCAVQNKK